mgnify:CR=1 FL=1
MKRRGIKNLIIDFGGVLIDLDRQRCLENFRKLGLPDVEVMLDLYHQQDSSRNMKRVDYQCGVPGSDSWKDRETGD